MPITTNLIVQVHRDFIDTALVEKLEERCQTNRFVVGDGL